MKKTKKNDEKPKKIIEKTHEKIIKIKKKNIVILRSCWDKFSK